MDLNTLRLQRPYMHGPAVKRLQENLDTLGADTGDNDGIFGPNTERAVRMIQTVLGLCVDGIYGPKTRRAVLNAVDKQSETLRENTVYPIPGVVDIRHTHDKPKLYGRPRELSSISAVMFHQTGCEMPKKPLSWGRVNAHYGLTQEGVAILLNDLRDMIWHGHKPSIWSIGIEIEGNFHGLVGNNRTLWKGGGGPHFLNHKMLEGVEHIKEDIRYRLERDVNIIAHRQSSENRPWDPGEAIYSMMAVPWAEEQNAGLMPKAYYGSGQSVHKEWLK